MSEPSANMCNTPATSPCHASVNGCSPSSSPEPALPDGPRFAPFAWQDRRDVLQANVLHDSAVNVWIMISHPECDIPIYPGIILRIFNHCDKYLFEAVIGPHYDSDRHYLVFSLYNIDDEDGCNEPMEAGLAVPHVWSWLPQAEQAMLRWRLPDLPDLFRQKLHRQLHDLSVDHLYSTNPFDEVLHPQCRTLGESSIHARLRALDTHSAAAEELEDGQIDEGVPRSEVEGTCLQALDTDVAAAEDLEEGQLGKDTAESEEEQD